MFYECERIGCCGSTICVCVVQLCQTAFVQQLDDTLKSITDSICENVEDNGVYHAFKRMGLIKKNIFYKVIYLKQLTSFLIALILNCVHGKKQQ